MDNGLVGQVLNMHLFEVTMINKNNSMKRVLLFLIIVLLFVGISSATDYYVSTTGNNGNAGTLEEPFATPSFIIANATFGDTIYLINGTWINERIAFNNTGTVGNPITITAYNGTPTLTGNGTGNAFYAYSLWTTFDYITISNITIQNYSSAINFEAAALTTTRVSNITLSNLTINDISGTPIKFTKIGAINYPIHNIKILNNTISDFGSSGIYFTSVKDSVVSNNDIIDADSATGWVGIGYIMQNITVESNYINNISVDYAISSSGTGANDNKIYNNTIMDIPGRGIRFDYSRINNDVIGNTVQNTNGAGLDLYPGTITNVYDNTFNNSWFLIIGANYSHLKNNTIKNGAHIDITGHSGYNSEVLFEENEVTDMSSYFNIHYLNDSIFRNNIFSNLSSVNFITTNGEPSYNITISNNVFYNIDHDAIDVTNNSMYDLNIKNNIFGNISGYAIDNHNGEETTATNNLVWNNGTIAFNGINPILSIFENPLFYNVLNNDFHLNSTEGTWNGTSFEAQSNHSPAIDAGNVSDNYSLEPFPSGNRINIGTYGNTIYASKSDGETPAEPFVVGKITTVTYNSTSNSFEYTYPVAKEFGDIASDLRVSI